MGSPFPGMDPYLENTDFWEGFHNGFMHYVQEDLQPRLPSNYVAALEMRIYFQPEGETQDAYISLKEIPSGRLVTSIEILSPANKTPGVGRATYLATRRQLYGQGVNLVELDFLRGGRSTLLVSGARLARLQPFHYLAGIFRAFDPLKYEVLTWSVRDPFPVAPIPLDEGVEEVPLDLGRVFERTFVTAALHRLLNYTGEPEPPLAPEDAAWAGELLRVAGYR